MAGVALVVDAVTVEFGSFRAIDTLSLAIDFGEVRAVIGPNGAGKTTLLDVISGITRPRQGRVIFGDKTDIVRASEFQIARAGIRRKFQKPSIFEGLNVRQHIEIGAQGGLRRTLSKDPLDTRVAEVLDAVGLSGLADRSASELAHGQKQWLEIGMLLAQSPKLLLVDEPAAGMTDEETRKTGELLMGLEGTHSIMVIEHDMTFVRQIARKVTVLHQGTVLCEGSVDQVQNDERVKEVYLGRKKKGAT